MDGKDFYRSTMTTIQAEFAATLEGVVPPADATAVAEILLPGGK